MNEPPLPPGASDVTQPIPVVAVEPPVRRVSPAAPPPFPPANPMPPQPPLAAQQPAVVLPARYVHRFGSVPFYLFARFAAFAIDLFLVAFLIATFVFTAFDAGLLTGGPDQAGYDALAGGAIAGALIFALLCEAIFGTTLGKLVFALHTRRINGRHAGGLRVLVRYLLRPIDLMLVGPLLALVTPRHQRIGDLLSGTVVSRSRIGGFASLLGIALLVAIGYAQAVFGGGITSAIGVTAETASFAPALVRQASAALGLFPHLAAPHPLAQPSVIPTATAQPAPQNSAAGGVQ